METVNAHTEKGIVFMGNDPLRHHILFLNAP
jgi:hypothetical protein